MRLPPTIAALRVCAAMRDLRDSRGGNGHFCPRRGECLRPTVSGTVGSVHSESTGRRARRDSRWDEHRRARREQLVEATLAAVGKHGAGVGMDEIAAEAGTSKTLVYRHFADCTELHVAVCAHVPGRLTAKLREAITS